MLSAQKENTRLQVAPSTPNTPMPGGFGKVLNSIEGLQQRLDDFSLDDIGAATEKAKTLTLRLSELERKLTDLTEITRSMDAVRRAVDGAVNETSKLTKSEAPERPLHLQAIVQASNLIRFPRLAKVPKDNSRTFSRSPIPTEASVDIAQSEISVASEKPAAPIQACLAEETLPTTQVKTTFPQENQTPVEELPVVDASVTPSSAVDQQIRSQEMIPDIVPSSLTSGETRPVNEFADHNPALETESNDAPALEPTLAFSEKEPSENETTTDSAAKTDFDQRLLDDLIRNYGEFAASADLPVPLKSHTETTTQTKTQHKHAKSKAPEEKPAKNNVPSLKKDGELDRQLKKLIKDYGEYDLYRQQSPISLKTGVIAAFLLLAIVLSGFYFFSSRQPAHPPHNSVTTSNNSEATGGTSPSSNVDSGTGKVISSGNSAATDRNQAEDDKSQRAVNDPSLKRNKKEKAGQP